MRKFNQSPATNKNNAKAGQTDHQAVLKTEATTAENTMQNLTFTRILETALTEPGIISAAYRAFHNFSLGNQILAAIQLGERGLPLTPIASFKAWGEKGRTVKKGQKAISLYMPVTIKAGKKDDAEKVEKTEQDGETKAKTFTRFALKPHWFALAQTEGDDYSAEIVVPGWDAGKALAALDIEQVEFEHLDGNCQGFARNRTIAINPLAVLPHKTRFHELAHVVLGHTTTGEMSDASLTRDVREVEAEGTAYVLCTLLDLPGQAESRGYIQSWAAGEAISEKTAQRIFSTANKILAVGQ